ncbi:MAG: hypothetical protein ABSF47_02660 [Minisyncoccia bacterium]|jgi:hypothetical protein
MGTISVEQRFAVLAKLGENVDWNSLTREQVQVGITDSERAGREATEFIRNGFCLNDIFRIIETLSIPIPALSRPNLEELQEFSSLVHYVKRDTSPTEAVVLNIATVLRSDEDQINGREYETRINTKSKLILGYQHAIWLAEHQGEFPELMKLLGKSNIDFPGLVVDVTGDLRVPCLSKLNERWSLRWESLCSDFGQSARVAFSGK